MGTHAEAHGNRFEVFLLFVNAVTGPPPPRLMNKRSVRRIHEPDDAVIDTAGKIGGQMRDFEFPAKIRYSGYKHSRRNGFRKTCTRRRRFRYKHPDVAVPLFAGVASGIDPIDFQVLT